MSLQGNPFAALSVENVQAVESSPAIIPTDRGMMFFDFETVPDESKWPRPSETDIPKPEFDPYASDFESLDVAGFFKVNSTAAAVTATLKANKYSQTQLLDLRSFEQSQPGKSGNRSTVLKAIAAELEYGDKIVADWETEFKTAFDKWKKECSVNPIKARICAFGWAIGATGEVHRMTARSDDDERAICEKFWELVRNGRQRCGYNIFNFDDLLIGIRSLILGVTPSIKLQRKKFANDQAVDLMVRLFPSGNASKCKDVCYSLGIDIPAGDMEGSQVFDLFEDGDMDAIGGYVASDVAVERELYFKLCEVFAG